MNILIVDDNNDKIKQIVSVIKGVSESFNIDTVIDSISAQVKLRQNKYDLLLLDLLLPIRVGQEPIPEGGALLLKEINRNSKLIPPTIIVGITQYEKCQSNFSSIWKLFLFNNEEWKDDLKQIIQHLERSIKFQSKAFMIKKPTIIVEGETDSIILKEAISIYNPDYLDKIDINFQKSGGANWVANQIVAWAFSHYKDEKNELIKSIGLLDGDQAGIDANKEINRVVKVDCTGATSFKIIKLKPDYAINTISLYQKGLALPITLEEIYTPNFWHYAEENHWLEARQNIDTLLKDPRQWNKMNQSLNDFINTLGLNPDEKIYLKKFKLSSKEIVVKHIVSLGEEEKISVLRNFETLTKDIFAYLFK